MTLDEDKVMKRWLDAEEALMIANYKMAEANLARGKLEENRGNRRGAAFFYYDAGSCYRSCGAPDEALDIADSAYRRCR